MIFHSLFEATALPVNPLSIEHISLTSSLSHYEWCPALCFLDCSYSLFLISPPISSNTLTILLAFVFFGELPHNSIRNYKNSHIHLKDATNRSLWFGGWAHHIFRIFCEGCRFRSLCSSRSPWISLISESNPWWGSSSEGFQYLLWFGSGLSDAFLPSLDRSILSTMMNPNCTHSMLVFWSCLILWFEM